MQVTSLLVIQCFWPVTSTSCLSSQVSYPFISFIFFCFLSVIQGTKVTLHLRRLLPSLFHIVKLIFKFYVQVFALLWFFLICFMVNPYTFGFSYIYSFIYSLLIFSLLVLSFFSVSKIILKVFSRGALFFGIHFS